MVELVIPSLIHLGLYYITDTDTLVYPVNIKKSKDKMYKLVLWSTQGGDFNTNYTSKVGIVMYDIGDRVQPNMSNFISLSGM